MTVLAVPSSLIAFESLMAHAGVLQTLAQAPDDTVEGADFLSSMNRYNALLQGAESPGIQESLALFPNTSPHLQGLRMFRQALVTHMDLHGRLPRADESGPDFLTRSAAHLVDRHIPDTDELRSLIQAGLLPSASVFLQYPFPLFRMPGYCVSTDSGFRLPQTRRVYIGYSFALKRNVAVKFYPEHASSVLRMFAQLYFQGRMARDPTVTTVLDAGYEEAENRPFLVQEYMAGGDLQNYALYHRPHRADLPWIQAVTKRIATILAKLHEKGILFRDVKPSNFLLSEDYRTLKISDFELGTTIEAIKEMDLRPFGPDKKKVCGTPGFFPKPLRKFGDTFRHDTVPLVTSMLVLMKLLTLPLEARRSALVRISTRIRDGIPFPLPFGFKKGEYPEEWITFLKKGLDETTIYDDAQVFLTELNRHFPDIPDLESLPTYPQSYKRPSPPLPGLSSS